MYCIFLRHVYCLLNTWHDVYIYNRKRGGSRVLIAIKDSYNDVHTLCIILKEPRLKITPILSTLFEQSTEYALLLGDYIQEGQPEYGLKYRPISLTCICSKLLELVICKHMWEHLDQHNIVTDRHHQFIWCQSCEFQIIITTNDFFQPMYSNTHLDMAIFDLSKVFDTVSHDKLLSKRDHYGIRGPILTWISVFLKQCDQ